MSNSFTDASFIVPLSREQAAFALAVFQCANNTDIDFRKKHKTVTAKTYPNDVYKIAKKVALSTSDYDPNWVQIDFVLKKHDEGVLIEGDESINPDNAAYFVQLILKHFDLNVCLGIEASHTDDKSRPGVYGWHAAFVTKKNIKWMTTHDWIHQQTERFNKQFA